MKSSNPKQCNADQKDLQHKVLSKNKTFAAHFSFFRGTPVCRRTQFGKHWSWASDQRCQPPRDRVARGAILENCTA